jgi:hypothetical protein
MAAMVFSGSDGGNHSQLSLSVSQCVTRAPKPGSFGRCSNGHWRSPASTAARTVAWD